MKPNTISPDQNGTENAPKFNSDGSLNGSGGIDSTSAYPNSDQKMEMPSTASGAVGEHSSNSNDKRLRQQIGTRFSNISDLINDNLAVFRYATFSTVLLVGIYGVANTPLFYRYKNVADIPTKMFIKRKRIHGRIVGVLENEGRGRPSYSSMHSSSKSSDSSASSPSSNTSKQSNNGPASLLSSPIQMVTGNDSSGSCYSNKVDMNKTISADNHPEQIVLLFRHSSPMERLLSQSAIFKAFASTGLKSSSRILYSSVPYRNLLPVELAGVAAPPSHTSSSTLSTSSPDVSSNKNHILNQLIKHETNVSLQLLAHQTNFMEEGIQGSVICHLYYRKPKQWFKTTNASMEMVQKGQACINSCGMVVPLSNTADIRSNNKIKKTVTDFNPTLKQIQNDAEFVSQLEKAEYSSWKEKVGIWSSDEMRGMREEYLEEEENLENKWSTSIWSWVKKGLGWIRRNR